jgi:hypothetical protein
MMLTFRNHSTWVRLGFARSAMAVTCKRSSIGTDVVLSLPSPGTALCLIFISSTALKRASLTGSVGGFLEVVGALVPAGLEIVGKFFASIALASALFDTRGKLLALMQA